MEKKKKKGRPGGPLFFFWEKGGRLAARGGDRGNLLASFDLINLMGQAGRPAGRGGAATAQQTRPG